MRGRDVQPPEAHGGLREVLVAEVEGHRAAGAGRFGRLRFAERAGNAVHLVAEGIGAEVARVGFHGLAQEGHGFGRAAGGAEQAGALQGRFGGGLAAPAGALHLREGCVIRCIGNVFAIRGEVGAEAHRFQLLHAGEGIGEGVALRQAEGGEAGAEVGGGCGGIVGREGGHGVFRVGPAGVAAGEAGLFAVRLQGNGKRAQGAGGPEQRRKTVVGFWRLGTNWLVLKYMAVKPLGRLLRSVGIHK